MSDDEFDPFEAPESKAETWWFFGLLVAIVVIALAAGIAKGCGL